MFEIADIIGIIAFSFSGVYIAIKKEFDLLGISIAAFLTALGGGIIRDIIVGIQPTSLINYQPFSIVLIVMLITILFKLHKNDHFDQKPMFVFIDSIGLMSFSISGALLAIEYGFSLPGIIIITFITAVGGGMIRDVLMNEVPYVMTGGFYGTIAIITAIIVYLLNLLNFNNQYSLWIVMICGIILRNLAFKYNFSLLKIKI